jgi:hypothetical protein
LRLQLSNLILYESKAQIPQIANTRGLTLIAPSKLGKKLGDLKGLHRLACCKHGEHPPFATAHREP